MFNGKFVLARMIKKMLLARISLAEALFFGTFIFIVCVYYPGGMSPDSLSQYEQALSGVYNDWHPPIMAFVWSLFLLVKNGPQGMLFFHLSMLFGASWLLYKYWSPWSPWAMLFLLLPAFPPVMVISGVIWKDVGLAFSLLFSYAIFIHAEEKSGWMKRLLYFISSLLFCYAFMVRANALFACAPLLFYVFYMKFGTRSLVKPLACAIACVAIGLGISMCFNTYVVGAEKTRPTRIMKIEEILAASIIFDKNLFSKELGSVSELSIKELLSAKKQSGWNFYTIPSDGTAENDKILYANWRDVIFTNPSVYLHAKYRLLKEFLVNEAAGGCLRIEENVYGIKFPEVYDTVIGMAFRLVTSTKLFLNLAYSKLIWLCIALALFGYAFFSKNIYQVHIRALTSSGLCYLSAYVIVSPSPDYRFVYWLVIATSVSIVLFVMDRMTRPLQCDSE